MLRVLKKLEYLKTDKYYNAIINYAYFRQFDLQQLYFG